ncbi:FAD-binding oxidoreductase [Roseomonas sp. F4]
MSAVLTRFDKAALVAALGDVPWSDAPAQLKLKSRDFYWFSPVLAEKLDACRADLVAMPRDEADVIRIAATCARLRVPLVVRGAGTGNYGQATPFFGGVVMEMTGLNRLRWIEPGRIRAQVGIRIAALDALARKQGQELRHHPSTKRLSTIGGFFAGGSGGVGAVTHGGLREPGNLLGARVITVEETPRIIELRGQDTGLVNRTFGSTGIVTEIEMPLDPVRPWQDVLVSFPEINAALRFGRALAEAPGIAKKLVSLLGAPTVALMAPLRALVPPGRDVVPCMVDAGHLPALRDLVAAHGGQIDHSADSLAAETDPARTPIFEFTYGHTTLHALKSDKAITYLQSLYDIDRAEAQWAAVQAQFPDQVLAHFEFIVWEGRTALSGVHLIRWSTAEHLQSVMDFHESIGAAIANPHVSTVEDGSRYKLAPGDQLRFKAEVDPRGLLNPGKMRSFVPQEDAA